MGRRYYCDYCNKSFIDELGCRKKHLTSLAHRLAKKEYYLQIRDMKTLVQEEEQKKVCMKNRRGQCPYGISCTFTHYTPEELFAFRQEVSQAEQSKFKAETIIPSVEEWLAKRRCLVDRGNFKNSELSEEKLTSCPGASLKIENFNLVSSESGTPSLAPVASTRIKNIVLEEWGT